MHYLHKILVHIPDVKPEGKVTEDEIRSYAEKETEDYYGKVFDWRVTNCAGRWSGEYPENVILASDDIERFLSEIEEARQNQADTAAMLLSTISDEVKELKIKELCDCEKLNTLDRFAMLFVSRIIAGEYSCDSYYYDISNYTSKILDETLKNIKAHPENWAMCFFDCHN